MSSDSRVLRRRFSLGVAAGLAATLFPLPARSRTAKARVLIVGGSTMEGGLGLFLERHLEESGYPVERRGKKSSGLARPDYFDWPREAARLHGSFSPDVSVVMFGGNDGMGLYMGKKADPKWIRPDDEAWDLEYRRRVAALADILAPGSEQLIWIGMPAVEDAKLNGRVKRMNVAFEAEMSARANGHYLDTWPLLTDDGKYTARIQLEGKRVRVRAPDGVHLTPAGAKYLVEHVAERIESIA